MLVTLLGITNSVISLLLIYRCLLPGILQIVLPLQYSAKLVILTFTSFRASQPENALHSMLVTLLGIVMLVRLLQPSKAPPPISTTPSGMVYVVRSCSTISMSLPSTIRQRPSSDAYLPVYPAILLSRNHILSTNKSSMYDVSPVTVSIITD